MAGSSAKSNRHKMAELQIALRQTDRELGETQWDLARELTTLAEQTGETGPLIQAVEALRSAKLCYSFEDAPVEHALVQQSIADTLLVLGRKTNDRDALTTARDAYRGAITLASLLSDDALREDLRVNYKLTLTLLGDTPQRGGLFKVA